MPTAPISMRKLKEILRLKYGCKLSHRKIANSLSISPSSVSTYSARAALFGITSWPLDKKWTDDALNRAFLKAKLPDKKHTMPDCSVLNQELI